MLSLCELVRTDCSSRNPKTRTLFANIKASDDRSRSAHALLLISKAHLPQRKCTAYQCSSRRWCLPTPKARRYNPATSIANRPPPVSPDLGSAKGRPHPRRRTSVHVITTRPQTGPASSSSSSSKRARVGAASGGWVFKRPAGRRRGLRTGPAISCANANQLCACGASALSFINTRPPPPRRRPQQRHARLCSAALASLHPPAARCAHGA